MADIATLALKVENGDVVKATASLDGMTVAGGKTEAATQRLTRRMALAEIEARKMDAAMDEASRTSFKLTGGVGGLTSALQALAGAYALREAIQLADTYTNLQSRLRLVTAGAEDLKRVQGELYAVSQQTRTGLESNVALYTSLARSTKSLGVSQSDLITMTRTVSEAFAVSGASANETSNAVRQLGQAMASGVLRGDEFNSIAENAPRLQQAVADSLGVTNGQLRAMAAEGKITSSVLANALLKSAKDISAEFQTMPVTVGGAMTQIKNALLVGVGAVDGATGSSAGLASALQDIAKAIPGIATAVNQFFGGLQIAAADAGIAFEKMKRSMHEIQIGAGQAIARVPGLGGLGASLIGQSADQLKDADDNIRLMEKERDILIQKVHGQGQVVESTKRVTQATQAMTAATKEDIAAAKAQADAREKAWQAHIQAAGQAAQEEFNTMERAKEAAKAQTDAIVQGVKDMQQRIRDAVKGTNAVIVEQTQSTFEKLKGIFQAGQRIFGAAGAGFGAGYGIGSHTGSATQGAIGGAASGAMAGFAVAGPAGAAVGAIAGFVGGIIGAGKAAAEAAKQMAELQKSLALNIQSIKAGLAGDTLGQNIARTKADFDALRKQTEDAYAGGSASSEQVRKRNQVLAELNSLEAQRIQQLRDEAALVTTRLQEDIRIQILRNNGETEAADAMAQAIEQERRFIELRKSGISDALIEELRMSEATRDAKRQADDAALAAAQELEKAANAAADAAKAAADQARAVADINIELARAKGDDGLAFQLEQQQRLEDAQKNQSAEYVQKLLELQQIQRDSRAAQQLIDSTGVQQAGGGGGSRGATSASTSVSASVTDRNALALVDLTRTGVTQRSSMIAELKGIRRALAGGGGGSVTAIDEALGQQQSAFAIFSGSVSR